MHLLNDENGNPIPHSHEDGHCGQHEHCEEHGHCHAKEEGECHGHHHHHHHDLPQGADKTTALLDYMLKHNESHTAELDQMAQRLAQEGKTEAADQVKKAVDEFMKGNMYLKLALSALAETK